MFAESEDYEEEEEEDDEDQASRKTKTEDESSNQNDSFEDTRRRTTALADEVGPNGAAGAMRRSDLMDTISLHENLNRATPATMSRAMQRKPKFIGRSGE